MVEASPRLSDKEPACQMAGDTGLISGSERSLGGGNGNLFQYSYLWNCMDRRAWLQPMRPQKSQRRLVTKQQQPHADWSLTVQIVFTLKRLFQKKKKKKKERKKEKKRKKPLSNIVLHDFFPLPSISIMMVTHILNLTKFYNNVICICSYTSVLNFTSVQSLSPVWLFVTPWTAARQASLSITNFWSLLKLMTIT